MENLNTVLVKPRCLDFVAWTHLCAVKLQYSRTNFHVLIDIDHVDVVHLASGMLGFGIILLITLPYREVGIIKIVSEPTAGGFSFFFTATTIHRYQLSPTPALATNLIIPV
jgi:hypothetical protein